ncbi:DUF1684 domain-containing protein [Lysobacter enzymogenes]|uniref:DUF1684 domain-containing protein n=1 Tax=Lysobacter enzymogenes TaxID=69 RepID=UPI001AF603BB|nr:DUF1684 domain-containing protein [Lysobacter enzymogenes]QQP99421.1 DUF1684 domain-containing protein [Lysobacter enzymogenes]
MRPPSPSIRTRLALALLLTLPLAAQADPRKDYDEFRAGLTRQASGATGMYAIQDVRVIAAGAGAHLPAGAPAAALRWADGAGGAKDVRLRFRDGAAMLEGPGLKPVDLLKAPDQTQALAGGLSVRATVYDDALKAWLYNPARVGQTFKGLSFFPYDPKGVVQARFARRPAKAVSHLDSRNHTGTMYWIGDVAVPLQGKTYTLRAFNKSGDWSGIDHLLLFFTDKTSKKTSYGGGRVLEAHFPAGQPPQTLNLNLNTLYSFLCAHSDYYNCPVNLTTYVPVALEFGEKYPPGG